MTLWSNSIWATESESRTPRHSLSDLGDSEYGSTGRGRVSENEFLIMVSKFA